MHYGILASAVWKLIFLPNWYCILSVFSWKEKNLNFAWISSSYLHNKTFCWILNFSVVHNRAHFPLVLNYISKPDCWCFTFNVFLLMLLFFFYTKWFYECNCRCKKKIFEWLLPTNPIFFCDYIVLVVRCSFIFIIKFMFKVVILFFILLLFIISMFSYAFSHLLMCDNFLFWSKSNNHYPSHLVVFCFFFLLFPFHVNSY